MRCCKYMEKTETRKRRGSVGKGYYDFKEDSLGRPMKKEVGEQATRPGAFPAERKATSNMPGISKQGTARRLVMWLEGHKQHREC